MQNYKILNNQPVSEDHFFWKYGDTVRLQPRVVEHPIPHNKLDSPEVKEKTKTKPSATPTPKKTATARSTSPIPGQNQHRHQKIIPTKDRKQQEELAECTFKPSLVADNSRFGVTDTEFLRRCELWQENKQNKLVRQRQQETQTTLKECTFQPKISEMSKNIIFAIGQDENTRFEKYHKQMISGYHIRKKLTQILMVQMRESIGSHILGKDTKIRVLLVNIRQMY